MTPRDQLRHIYISHLMASPPLTKLLPEEWRSQDTLYPIAGGFMGNEEPMLIANEEYRTKN